MKKALTILFAVLLVLSLAACAGKTDETKENTSGAPQTAPAASAQIKTVINEKEYTLYQNIFFNDMAGDYTGKPVEKTGIFAEIRDFFNDVTRYYVWGYMDGTKCCDWQWELKVPSDRTASLPEPGSYIKVTGTFEGDESALDKYWITDPQITVVEPYENDFEGMDMRTLNCTLERVQMINCQQFPDKIGDTPVAVYGRVLNIAAIQNPYYDGSWTQDVDAGDLPGIGVMVEVVGAFRDGVLTGKAALTDRF